VAAHGAARGRWARSLSTVELTATEIVRRAFEAWATRDLDEMVPYYHPDAVYDCSLRILNPEVYVGHEELRRFSAEIDAIWDVFDVTLEDLIEIDEERVLVLMRSNARGRSSGVELVDTKAATVFTVRDGQIVHSKLYPERRDAFSEAGIPYPETE